MRYRTEDPDLEKFERSVEEARRQAVDLSLRTKEAEAAADRLYGSTTRFIDAMTASKAKIPESAQPPYQAMCHEHAVGFMRREGLGGKYSLAIDHLRMLADDSNWRSVEVVNGNQLTSSHLWVGKQRGVQTLARWILEYMLGGPDE